MDHQLHALRSWLHRSRTENPATSRQPLRPPGQPTPNGEVWFAWAAGRDEPGNPNKCNNGRPQPYVYIARVDDQTLQQVGEYDIWNSAYAFAYPALATDPDAEIGVALAWGGPSNYGSTAAGYLGDFVVYYNEASAGTVRGRSWRGRALRSIDRYWPSGPAMPPPRSNPCGG